MIMMVFLLCTNRDLFSKIWILLTSEPEAKKVRYISKSKTPDRICMDITTISTVLKKDKQPKT